MWLPNFLITVDHFKFYEIMFVTLNRKFGCLQTFVVIAADIRQIVKYIKENK